MIFNFVLFLSVSFVLLAYCKRNKYEYIVTMPINKV